MLAKEKNRPIGIATTAERIYWWSTADSRIVSVRKDRPSEIETVIARPGQNVNALAVDAAGMYWLESGPDVARDGGTTTRVMTGNGSAPPVAIYRAAAPFQRLVISVGFVVVLGTGAMVVLGRTNDYAVHVAATSDGRVFGNDGTDTFYSDDHGGISAFSAIGSTRTVVSLPAPQQVVFDSANLYTVVTDAASSRLVRVDKASVNAPATAAVSLTAVAAGASFVASDTLGIVWLNENEGVIRRIARSGEGSPETVASGVAGVNALAADGDGVYWTSDDGTVGWTAR